MSQAGSQMSGEGMPPPLRSVRQAVHVAVRTTADSSFVPVYAVRSPADLKSVWELTKPGSRDAIGGYLVGEGVITREDLREALAIQRHSASRRLGWILCTLGHLDEVSLARLMAAHHGVPCVTLAHFRAADDYGQRLPEAIAGAGRMAVLHEEAQQAWIAVADVTDRQAAKDASAALGKAVVRVMASREEIAAFLGARGTATGTGEAAGLGW